MVSKLLTEIPLVPCAVDIEAKAGDKLMVFNGVVIGVYTGQEAAPAKDPVRVEAGRKGGRKKQENAQLEAPRSHHSSDKKRPIPGQWSKERIAELDAKILATLQGSPDMSLGAVAKALKVPRKTPIYEKIRQRLRALTFTRQVESATPENGSRMNTTYRLNASRAA